MRNLLLLLHISAWHRLTCDRLSVLYIGPTQARRPLQFAAAPPLLLLMLLNSLKVSTPNYKMLYCLLHFIPCYLERCIGLLQYRS